MVDRAKVSLGGAGTLSLAVVRQRVTSSLLTRNARCSVSFCKAASMDCFISRSSDSEGREDMVLVLAAAQAAMCRPTVAGNALCSRHRSRKTLGL